MKKIMIVVGARPNFMKAAPIVFAIREYNKSAESLDQLQCVLVHTGQHYDGAMSGSFFSDLSLPRPDIQLGVGSGSHAVQTAEIMRRFEAVLLELQPDLVAVVGDVNSTVACALVTAKIVFDSNGTRPLIAHIESGLRSFDTAMPEEINRVITDHLSDLLFVTEESGVRNLQNEGVAPERVHFVGNTMIDSLLASKHRAEQSTILNRFGLRLTDGSGNGASRYALLTLHRPSNVDNRETFLGILEGVEELSRSCPILFSAHPRTQKRIAEFGFQRFFRVTNESECGQTTGIHLLNPLGYLDFLCLMSHASIVVTDSGGIQEETTCLRVPCVTVRENTERPITVTCGTNKIAGTDSEDIRTAIRSQMKAPKHSRIPEKWDGQAAHRIVQILAESIDKQDAKGPQLASQRY